MTKVIVIGALKMAYGVVCNVADEYLYIPFPLTKNTSSPTYSGYRNKPYETMQDSLFVWSQTGSAHNDKT